MWISWKNPIGLTYWGYEMNTKHFEIRTQQRGIPPGAQELLDRFGDLQYDGNVHRMVYFSGTSKKKMGKELGRSFVRVSSRVF